MPDTKTLKDAIELLSRTAEMKVRTSPEGRFAGYVSVMGERDYKKALSILKALEAKSDSSAVLEGLKAKVEELAELADVIHLDSENTKWDDSRIISVNHEDFDTLRDGLNSLASTASKTIPEETAKENDVLKESPK